MTSTTGQVPATTTLPAAVPGQGTSWVSAVDAALRTGLAGGSAEMVSAFPALAAEGRFDLADFTGPLAQAVTWPEVVIEETGSF